MTQGNDTAGKLKSKRISQFRLYSMGILTEAVTVGKMEIEVQLIEVSWAANGKLDSNFEEMVVTTTDPNQGDVQNAILTGNVITATWLPDEDSNRISPPCLQARAIVEVYVDGDNNYYWTNTGLGKETMRLEVVTHAYCNNPNADSDAPVNPSKWWIKEISTIDGHAFFQTNTSNDEPTAWLFMLDTKNGIFYLEDDFNNRITVDSVNTIIRIENNVGGYYEMNKEDLTIDMPGNITINAGKNVSINSKGDMSLDSQAKFDAASVAAFTLNTESNMLCKASGDFTAEATGGVATLRGVTYSLDGTSGSGSSTGSMTMDGSITSTKGTIEGPSIHSTGNITAGGNIHANGIVSGSNI